MSHASLPNKQLFYEQVWALVRQIPCGKVATYGQITNMLQKHVEVSHEDFQTFGSRWVGHGCLP
ncbi:MAG: MGMT family protein [Pseudomonadota bacterium]